MGELPLNQFLGVEVPVSGEFVGCKADRRAVRVLWLHIYCKLGTDPHSSLPLH